MSHFLSAVCCKWIGFSKVAHVVSVAYKSAVAGTVSLKICFLEIGLIDFILFACFCMFLPAVPSAR